jgi:hypothetical protein
LLSGNANPRGFSAIASPPIAQEKVQEEIFPLDQNRKIVYFNNPTLGETGIRLIKIRERRER